MNLIDQIRSDEALKPFLADQCEENGLCVEFSTKISRRDYVIIKVDAFYNACNDYKSPETRLMNAPPSIDCLIVLSCNGNAKYRVLLVELKNTSRNPPQANMVSKFETTLKNFMSERFGNHFYDTHFDLEIGLYLKVAKLSDAQILRSVTAKYLVGLGTLRFGGRYYNFEKLPELVTPC